MDFKYFLSLPREIRNEIYQYFVPTNTTALGSFTIRFICRQIRDEFDEELIVAMTIYSGTLQARINQPEDLTRLNPPCSFADFSGNFGNFSTRRPVMAASEFLSPGFKATVAAPTSFSECRTVRIKVEKLHSTTFLEHVLTHTRNPYVQACIIEQTSTRDINVNVAMWLEARVEQYMEGELGISRWEIRGLRSVTSIMTGDLCLVGRKGVCFRTSNEKVEIYAPLEDPRFYGEPSRGDLPQPGLSNITRRI